MDLTNLEAVIGLEVHIQLNTEAKAFAPESAKYTNIPNQHISPVSLALPGTLPVMNKMQIEKAIRLGLALDCEINQRNYFDRKNYFYADLPKGYQITQDSDPVCLGGKFTLENGKTIRLHHIHMEEDAGKSVHDISPDYSMLDYNRAGVPLLEMVTEPDFRNGDEVEEFINTLRRLVRYLDVSDGVMQEGSMRCDVNLSLREKGSDVLNTRCEIKNINSASNAKKAVEQEFKRQLKLLKKGEEIKQSTLDFNLKTQKLTVIRVKENAHDYRYFPEPDLPPIIISDDWIESVKSNMGRLPQSYFHQLTTEYDLSEYDATILIEYKDIADLTLSLIQESNIDPKSIANFIVNKYLPDVKTGTDDLLEYPLSQEGILEFLTLIESKKITVSSAYQNLLPHLLEQPHKTAKQVMEEMDLAQDFDLTALKSIILDILDQNPDELKKYQNGKKNLFGFFMGEIMKATKGKSNPKEAKKELMEILNTRNG
ncbi:Asp-tRNA(Asn)/Glu-tRNA(Gln) amidotransferase subunit GatB [Membranihabitans marinus]|uniref:Asp-tRNA(Asn)/Glu-tRNA(Gln) amidotransferase subunit GatB n=1 Tax=Membranihabitans marinus TaxID=1227546 RepID=UPI001F02957A|nr:Asp-tRNA(Asn)/Glu-tRNA(Gln) amidotransferase subunit GatB [Membranihabitans marinus]